MNHVFTLQVSGIDPAQEDYENKLYEAGCGDALIAGIEGTLYLDFDREGPSVEQAIVSATDAVTSAGGKVLRVLLR